MSILELHVLRTETDSHLAKVADLPTVDGSDRCDHCQSAIGYTESRYVGYVLALTEDDAGDERYWYNCLPCAAPILAPLHD